MKNKIVIIIFFLLMGIIFFQLYSCKQNLQSEQNNYYSTIKDLYIQEYSINMYKFTNILNVYSKIENEQDNAYLKGLIDSYFLNNTRVVYNKANKYNKFHNELICSLDIQEQININLEEMHKVLEKIKEPNDIKKIDKNKYNEIKILSQKLIMSDLHSRLKDKEYFILLKEFQDEILSISKE